MELGTGSEGPFDIFIPPEQACDDCWNNFALYWTSDKRRRCQSCFSLHVAIITGVATDAQVAEHNALLGVQEWQRQQSD